MRPSDFPVERPVATVMLLVCLVVLGGVSLSRLPLAFFPMVERTMVEVEVPFPGSHPLESLREVAVPLEEEIATIPEVRSIRTSARGGSTWLGAEFSPSAQLDLMKMEVREAVERTRPRLPDEVDFVQISTDVSGPADGAILQGRISAVRDLSESWNLLERRIKRPLERIQGVARVELYGVEPQQVRVDVDLPALRRHGVLPREVMETLRAANLDMDLGALRGDVLRYDVRALARFRDLDAIRDLKLGGGQVRLRDVARVELREPRLDYGRHLDRRFAIGIDVFQEPTANTVDTVDRLMARIGEIENDPELEGITLLVWSNAGKEIRRALTGLRNAGIFGGILAVLVLYLFLRNLRTTLVIAVAIPFSLVVTCAGMYLVGAELNVISMLGLALGVGMMVDNAVVVLENIHRLEGRGLSAREAARRGLREVGMSVVAATATTMIVWSWLLVLERNEMTVQVGSAALPICLAVACSLLVSVTFIPLAAARFAPRKEVREGAILRRLVPVYRSLLGWTFRHRMLTLAGLMVLASSAAFPIVNIEKSGEPKFLERAVAIRYDVHDPSTKEVMEGHVDQVEAWLWSRRDELDFDSVYSWYQENQGAVTRVYLPEEKVSEEAVAKLRRQLREDLPTIAGVTLTVGEREWWRRPSRGDREVNVALHGDDPEYLESLAREVEARLGTLPDVVDVLGPGVRGTKEARVQVDPEKARALGLSPEAVARAVSFAFRGQRVRKFDSGDGEVDIVAGLPEDVRPGLSALADLPIPTASETTVPLSSVARIVPARTQPHIWREDRLATIWVIVRFDEEAVPNTEDARRRVATAMDRFPLPEGYAWSWGRWGRERDESLQTMLDGVALSLLLVILLMAALFESFTQPLAIVITLPLAFFGAFWSLWAFGHILDPVSFFGVILLIGIVVNNGIVMVNHVNALRRDGMDRVAALIQGCGDRLRPVLMTAVTTIFGLLPLAVSGFAVVQLPMASLAMAVIGGLATSTLFTLLALPVWYTTVEDLGSVVARALPRWTGRSARGRGARRGILTER